MADRDTGDDGDQPYERIGHTFPASVGEVSSTVPSSVVFGDQSELTLARNEIEELRKQLAAHKSAST